MTITFHECMSPLFEGFSLITLKALPSTFIVYYSLSYRYQICTLGTDDKIDLVDKDSLNERIKAEKSKLLK
jgi:hypothetical protein